MIGLLLKAGRRKILAVAFILTVLAAFLDWLVGMTVSLAALYILPMMTAAVVLRPVETAIFALVCSYLRARFVYAGTFAEQALHYVFAALSYFLSGLFVTTLVRNQELVSQHLQKLQVEQALRREAEEHLQLLAASSPAAILTTDQGGLVLSANQA